MLFSLFSLSLSFFRSTWGLAQRTDMICPRSQRVRGRDCAGPEGTWLFVPSSFVDMPTSTRCYSVGSWCMSTGLCLTGVSPGILVSGYEYVYVSATPVPPSLPASFSGTLFSEAGLGAQICCQDVCLSDAGAQPALDMRYTGHFLTCPVVL